MKKLTIALVITATLLAVLVSAGYVFAQDGAPDTPQKSADWFGQGHGRMSGRGAGMGSMMAGDGLLHDAMLAVFAEKLGLPVDALEARLEQGETMAQVASAEGLSAEEFTALMTSARSQAIDQAASDGTLTQEQADWMKQRGGRMGGRGMHGGAGDCPYTPQTNP